jgi:hypothetical protein
MKEIPQIIQVLSALLTPMIAFMGIMIAILQYQLARLRWRLDLYDKRYPVFTATMDYIGSVVSEADASTSRSFQFLRESKDKEFLFKKEVHVFLDTLYKNGVKIHSLNSILVSKSIGNDRAIIAKEIAEISKWFGEQFEICKIVFSPYLAVTEK